MRIIIDLDETKILEYGTIVIYGVTPNPTRKPEIAIPGFCFMESDQPVFSLQRQYNDARDKLLNQSVNDEEKEIEQSQSEAIEKLFSRRSDKD